MRLVAEHGRWAPSNASDTGASDICQQRRLIGLWPASSPGRDADAAKISGGSMSTVICSTNGRARLRILHQPVCRHFFSCEAHKADTRDASILQMLLLLLRLSAWASSSKNRLELNRRPRAGQAKRRNLQCLHGDPLLPPSPPSKSRFGPGPLPRRLASALGPGRGQAIIRLGWIRLDSCCE